MATLGACVCVHEWVRFRGWSAASLTSFPVTVSSHNIDEMNFVGKAQPAQPTDNKEESFRSKLKEVIILNKIHIQGTKVLTDSLTFIVRR